LILLREFWRVSVLRPQGKHLKNEETLDESPSKKGNYKTSALKNQIFFLKRWRINFPVGLFKGPYRRLPLEVLDYEKS
jgi:hypothetical protein